MFAKKYEKLCYNLQHDDKHLHSYRQAFEVQIALHPTISKLYLQTTSQRERERERNICNLEYLKSHNYLKHLKVQANKTRDLQYIRI